MDQRLDREEVQWFYAHHTNAEKLRTIACRFASEWKTLPPVYDAWSWEAALGSASDLMWWDDVAPDVSDLPADGTAWYYNPIRLLHLIAKPPVPDAGGEALVASVRGPRRIVAGHPVTYTARLDNHATATPEQRGAIHWVAERVGGGEITRVLQAGPTWTFTPKTSLLRHQTADTPVRVRVMAYCRQETTDVATVSTVVSGQ